MSPKHYNGTSKGHHAHQLTYLQNPDMPRLPIPPLEDSMKRYLRALEGLQDAREHAATKLAVEDFLRGEGPRLQQKLNKYAEGKASYIEEFWYESYLNHSDPVVLALNPFFVLEDDPTPSRGSQLPRAASLILSSLGFIHDLRNGLLEPDAVRGIPLDMDQYSRLFGTSRVPTDRGCRMDTNHDSRHIVVIRRGQFYYFDVIDQNNRPLLTEREILANLRAILSDADTTPPSSVAASALGVLTTENRRQWAEHRREIESNSTNAACINVVDEALFVVCLDDASPEGPAELCMNFLCGTYRLDGQVQTGTCTNRWYDKLQIIVCANGAAGINFEHTGVDGHTVLRFAADIYTDNLLLMARSINPKAPTLFKVKPSPHSKASRSKSHSQHQTDGTSSPAHKEPLHITVPRKLEWTLTPSLRIGIRFAETRLSDLICQNDVQVLEFPLYGKSWITRFGHFSPDAFVQMAFLAGYYGLYGRIECMYEPAMTKAFYHGRTEAIRSVQPESVKFTKTFFSDAPSSEKIAALRSACEAHVKLTKDCSKGLGQDRHLYALYCLLQREINETSLSPSSGASVLPNIVSTGTGSTATAPNGTPGAATPSKTTTTEALTPPPSPPPSASPPLAYRQQLPALFTDGGWSLLNTSILSTSNCGNPALRLFGFGPVAQDGFGIGYIIKDDCISICASSKHLQTRRFLDTIAQYLTDVQKLVMHIHRLANERSDAFMDHSGTLIDSRTGAPLVVLPEEEDEDAALVSSAGKKDGTVTPGGLAGVEEGVYTEGYSFYDSGEVEKLSTKRHRKRGSVGRTLRLAEY